MTFPYKKIVVLILGTTIFYTLFFFVTKPKIQTNPLIIEPLYTHPELISEILIMHQNEWKTGELTPIFHEDESLYNQLPFTFIAFYNDKLVGSCSLEKNNSIDSTLSPWATHLYVKPEYRGKKIGKKLIEKILKKTEEIGFKKLFYFTDISSSWWKNRQNNYFKSKEIYNNEWVFKRF